MATTIKPSPYMAARKATDERFGDFIARAENWRRACFVSAFTTLALVVGMIVLDFRSQTVPYVVALDSVGGTIPVVPAQQVAVKDVRLQAASVFRWLTDVRSVVTDPVVQRKMVDEAYAMTATNSAASNVLTEWYQSSSPFDRLTKETVDVNVESVVEQSSKSYEVVWNETTRDLTGQQLNAPHHYRAIVGITTEPVKDARQALINPLGLFVVNMSWGEIVTTDSKSALTTGGQK
jgi:type IV secretory pathway TrbF-like protein